jgi:hypothetical protein
LRRNCRQPNNWQKKIFYYLKSLLIFNEVLDDLWKETILRGLIITDLFPPDPGGRSEKMERHVKYFAKQGIIVDVLCPSTINAYFSHGMGKNLGACYRVKPLFMRQLASLKWQESFLPQTSIGEKWVKGKLPSGYIRWILPAYLKAFSLIKKGKYDFIMGVSNPVSTQIICMLLKKTFKNLIYIAELRDPLVGYFRSTHANITNTLLERRIAKLSDTVVEWKDFTPNPLFQKYPNIFEKSLYIDNVGFDPDEYFGTFREMTYQNSLNIVYTGGYYGEKELWELFFMAVHNLAGRGVNILVDYYGDWSVEQELSYNKLKNKDIVWLKKYGRVPKTKCIDACMAGNAMLYILDANEENLQRIGSKVYDYFACGRPILAIVPERSRVEKKIQEFNNSDDYSLSIPLNISIDRECLSQKLMKKIELLYERFKKNNIPMNSNFHNASNSYSCIDGESQLAVKISQVHAARRGVPGGPVRRPGDRDIPGDPGDWPQKMQKNPRDY